MPSSHDLFVKGILSNLNEAIDFFDGSLPESITKLLQLENLDLLLTSISSLNIRATMIPKYLLSFWSISLKSITGNS